MLTSHPLFIIVQYAVKALLAIAFLDFTLSYWSILVFGRQLELPQPFFNPIYPMVAVWILGGIAISARESWGASTKSLAGDLHRLCISGSHGYRIGFSAFKAFTFSLIALMLLANLSQFFFRIVCHGNNFDLFNLHLWDLSTRQWSQTMCIYLIGLAVTSLVFLRWQMHLLEKRWIKELAQEPDQMEALRLIDQLITMQLVTGRVNTAGDYSNWALRLATELHSERSSQIKRHLSVMPTSMRGS